MHSPNLTIANIEKIKALFPNCVTEAKDESGNLKLAVDFDQLRQELSDSIVEGPQERYHLNWPGKCEALLTAKAPIAKTLRPAPDESVDFENTQNLFIEGDNLDALKLLQETYLGKVKCIYIDPPYNTGNDFIYEDNFAENTEEFLKKTNQKDEAGNRLVANRESNGRFHSDWLTMIYPRLKIAQNLLSEDGVIFISIDDNEQANLKRVCDEIFGEENCVASMTIANDPRARSYEIIATTHEYLLVYSKSSDKKMNHITDDDKEFDYIDEVGGFDIYELRNRNVQFNSSNRPNLLYPFYLNPNNINENGFYEISLDKNTDWIEILPEKLQNIQTVWRWSKDKASQNLNSILFGKKTNNGFTIIKKYRENKQQIYSVWNDKEIQTDKGTLEVKKIFDGKKVFDFPKPVSLIKRILQISTAPNDLILDFFAGSGTTAQAVMELNFEETQKAEKDGLLAEDKPAGGRKFILVQLPEKIDEKKEAYKAGYRVISDITMERVRRAGGKYKGVDVGFRVLKVDTSNMADVYYTPDATNQSDLLAAVENIKPDRTPEDLLFQVMLDWGVDLSLPITKQTIQGKTVFFVNSFVNNNELVACFDDGITEEFVKEIAKTKAVRVVFKDNGFVSDSVKINAEQIFKQISSNTTIKVI